MNPKFLQYLRSPITGSTLELKDTVMKGDRVFSGTLTDGKNEWPIVDFIPRFVPFTNYADSFSLQWGNHPDIHFESDTGLTLYEDRFKKETRWPDRLPGEVILEAGCGTGCFTKYALDTGAVVLSFDLGAGSVASNYKMNGHRDNLLIVQADIYKIPFFKQFDRAFCFGVLQHTPDPNKSFQSILNHLRPGGLIATDIYASVKFRRFHGMLRAKYFLRRFTAGMAPEKLYKLIKVYVAVMWPIRTIISYLPGGVLLNQHLMFDNFPVRCPNMKPERFKEFAIVDIMDMLGAAYDLPATKDEFLSWHKQAQLEKIDVDYGYNGLEGRGTKPSIQK